VAKKDSFSNNSKKSSNIDIQGLSVIFDCYCLLFTYTWSGDHSQVNTLVLLGPKLHTHNGNCVEICPQLSNNAAGT